MGKKKPDIYEQQEQRRWQAYSKAPLMKDKFPTLASLSIDMTFQEPDWGKNPEPRNQSFGPESKAFFDMECPYVECISGGFDLSSAVSKLVDSGDTELPGTITCQGWQDIERIKKHRCLLKMEYKITAIYANDA